MWLVQVAKVYTDPNKTLNLKQPPWSSRGAKETIKAWHMPNMFINRDDGKMLEGKINITPATSASIRGEMIEPWP